MGGNPAYRTNVPSMWPVAAGDSRVVRLDITDIVGGWIADPSSNHGLVVGAITDPEVATVSLNTTSLGPDTAFRIRFLYQNRSGEEATQE